MLKYFSYYNVGGYKDMFLGDSTMTSESTFYLPLLPVWKKKAEAGDVSLAEKIESLEKLPKIKILTIDSNYGLSKSAFTLISHAGYKVYLSKLSSGESIFAIRDIDSNSKDESGRSIPFLLLVVGDTDSDRIVLEKMAAYAVSHIDEISKKIADLFSYNAKYNPYNCEQVALHIMRFMYRKFANEAPSGISGRLGSFLFGSITVKDMQEYLATLSEANLIKDNVEGIKTIKKCFDIN